MEIVIETTSSSGEPFKLILQSLNIEQCDIFATRAKAILLARCQKLLDTHPRLKSVVEGVIEKIILSDCALPSTMAIEFLQTIDGMTIALQLMSSAPHQIQMGDADIKRILETKYVEVQKAVIQLCPFLKTVGQTLGIGRSDENASVS